MNRMMFRLLAAAVFFLAAYLLVSFSLFRHVTQTREAFLFKEDSSSLAEESKRLASFLNRQSDALKHLTSMRATPLGIESSVQTSTAIDTILEFSHAQLYLAVDASGKSVKAAPERYAAVLAERNALTEVFKEELESLRRFGVSRPAYLRWEPMDGNSPFIFAYAPILRADGSLDGLMSLGFSSKKLFHEYFKALVDNNSSCEIVVSDLDGCVALSAEGSEVGTPVWELKGLKAFPRFEGFEKLKADVPVERKWTDADGKSFLLVYVPFDAGGRRWVSQMKIPRDLVTKFLLPLYWRLSLLLFLLALLTAVGAGLAIMTSRQIRQLKSRIDELEIQIDHDKKMQAADEISGSEYFRRLKEQADLLRK